MRRTKNGGKEYAQIVRVVLLLLGVLGLLLGERALLGFVNINIMEDIVHLPMGGILASVGFGQRDEGLARTVVGALGAVYLLVGLLGFVLPNLAWAASPRLQCSRQPNPPGAGHP
jgi:hypothetical protein